MQEDDAGKWSGACRKRQRARKRPVSDDDLTLRRGTGWCVIGRHVRDTRGRRARHEPGDFARFVEGQQQLNLGALEVARNRDDRILAFPLRARADALLKRTCLRLDRVPGRAELLDGQRRFHRGVEPARHCGEVTLHEEIDDGFGGRDCRRIDRRRNGLLRRKRRAGDERQRKDQTERSAHVCILRRARSA